MAVKPNIIANYFGQGWTALMAIAFLPQYIGYLGAEAYGLIGFFAALQTVFALLDMGITPTLVREMARFSSRTPGADWIREVLRTFEWVSLVAATLGWLAVFGAAEWIAGSWLQRQKLDLDEVVQAIWLLGLVAGLRLVEGLYRGALIGLQRQVWLNGAVSALATLRWVGGLGILAWWSPTIAAFFAWQALISFLTVAIFAVRVYQELPVAPGTVKFSLPVLKRRALFSSGMMANSALALLLTQSDKILLSKTLPLEEFGYYTLAVAMASLILQLVVPITQAFYPQLTKLLAAGDVVGLSRNFHIGSQMVGAAIFPLGLMLTLHGESILRLWSGNDELGKQIAQVLSLMVLGNLFHASMYMPNMVRLASGQAWLAVRINLIAVVVLVPSMLWAASSYGAVGAAWVWLGLNLGYAVLGVPFLLGKVFPQEIWTWFKDDFALPLAAATVALYAARLFEPVSATRVSASIFFLITGVMGVAVVVFVSPLLRQRVLASLGGFLTKN